MPVCAIIDAALPKLFHTLGCEWLSVMQRKRTFRSSCTCSFLCRRALSYAMQLSMLCCMQMHIYNYIHTRTRTHPHTHLHACMHACTYIHRTHRTTYVCQIMIQDWRPLYAHTCAKIEACRWTQTYYFEFATSISRLEQCIDDTIIYSTRRLPPSIRNPIATFLALPLQLSVQCVCV